MNMHGMCATKIYKRWHAMTQRCNNPRAANYQYYGGRGIAVCTRWLAFANFYADMGDPGAGMTLDRIDTNGGYNKENCRWVSRGDQQRNTRRSHFLEFNGKRQCVADWAREININVWVLRSRLKRNWPVTEALTKRPDQRYNHSKATQP